MALLEIQDIHTFYGTIEALNRDFQMGPSEVLRQVIPVPQGGDPSLQVRDMVLASGMDKGAAISYDRLEDLVAELQRS